MAKRSKSDGEKHTPPTRRGSQTPRLSISLPESTRRKLRLASALSDMEPGEWAKVVLVQAARRTVEKFYPDKV